jgi:hypothetical protein
MLTSNFHGKLLVNSAYIDHESSHNPEFQCGSTSTSSERVLILVGGAKIRLHACNFQSLRFLQINSLPEWQQPLKRSRYLSLFHPSIA